MPGLRYVVDHMGKPDLRNRPAESWSQTMRALGRLTNVSVKLSGIATESDVDWTIADLRPFVDVVLAHFGPERIMFCLLYTSDAADDLLCVDLGGRRII